MDGMDEKARAALVQALLATPRPPSGTYDETNKPYPEMLDDLGWVLRDEMRTREAQAGAFAPGPTKGSGQRVDLLSQIADYDRRVEMERQRREDQRRYELKMRGR
jgi:hypothetical protein